MIPVVAFSVHSPLALSRIKQHTVIFFHRGSRGNAGKTEKGACNFRPFFVYADTIIALFMSNFRCFHRKTNYAKKFTNTSSGNLKLRAGTVTQLDITAPSWRMFTFRETPQKKEINNCPTYYRVSFSFVLFFPSLLRFVPQ